MIPPREQSARCEDIFDHHDQGDAANIWWAEGPGMQLNTLPGTGQPLRIIHPKIAIVLRLRMLVSIKCKTVPCSPRNPFLIGVPDEMP